MSRTAKPDDIIFLIASSTRHGESTEISFYFLCPSGSHISTQQSSIPISNCFHEAEVHKLLQMQSTCGGTKPSEMHRCNVVSAGGVRRGRERITSSHNSITQDCWACSGNGLYKMMAWQKPNRVAFQASRAELGEVAEV